MQGKCIGDPAEVSEVAHLAPHVVMRDEGAARVGAQAHGNAVGQASAGALAHAVKHDAAVLASQLAAMAHLEWEEGIGNGGRKRADESGATLVEEL